MLMGQYLPNVMNADSQEIRQKECDRTAMNRHIEVWLVDMLIGKGPKFLGDLVVI
jgi:hypothetical protein